MVWTLPNILTVARIAIAPLLAVLPFLPGYPPKLLAFVLFIAAGVSDYYDGYIARVRGEVTDAGKILDPIADKLLLVATLVPIYVMSRAPLAQYALPWWGALPLWAVLLIVGRDVVMTAFRQIAKRRGVVIAAGGAGKAKTLVQDIFVGAAFAWFAWRDMQSAFGWHGGWFVPVWETFHGAVVAATLAAAVLLTAYSLGVYLYRYRHVLRGAPAADRATGHGP